MTKKSKQLDPDPASPKAVAKAMFRTLVSTTVRIFAPVAVLFLVGLAIDLNSATKPWGMAVGTGLGSIIAVALVAAQLKSFRQQPLTAEEAE